VRGIAVGVGQARQLTSFLDRRLGWFGGEAAHYSASGAGSEHRVARELNGR
jgi:hypothetical protein